MATEKPFSAQSVIKFANDNFGLLLLAAALFLGGFVSGSMWKENRMLASGVGGTANPVADAQLPAEAAPLSEADWKRVQENPAMVIGDANAPVTMVEFTDYQCPFCGRHYTETHGQIVDNFVKTGKLKIVYRDQALSFHPNANSAAQAVRCAEDADGGVALHDALFQNQDAWANLTGDAVLTKYKELADAAKLNGNNIVECVKSNKHKAAVDADSQLGNEVGAGGTPTFFIEGDPLVGAQPYSAFEAKINEKLNS